MDLTESETCELKREYSSGVPKEVVALLNTHGGTIYLGVEDDGDLVGVDSPDEAMLRVDNAVRDAINPDATLFVSTSVEVQGGVPLVVVAVGEGAKKPYYLSAKGLRPEGVYVRHGASSVPASDSAIRRMVGETDGDSFESMRSLVQELTFAKAGEVFEARGLVLGPAQMRTLGLVTPDGLYTNLALLLSDQCPHAIKAAWFEGTSEHFSFRDRAEFTGSLLAQLEDAYRYLDQLNRLESTVRGLERVDARDYPDEALREALVNSIVHRDYSTGAPVLLKLFDDELQVVNVGGLMKGIEVEDIMQGISCARNPRLANVLYRLSLVEAYGTGMARIFGSYRFDDLRPSLGCAHNSFVVRLPNRNAPVRGGSHGAEASANAFRMVSGRVDDAPTATSESTGRPYLRSRTELGEPSPLNAVNGAASVRDAVATFDPSDIERTVRFVESKGSVSRRQVEDLLGVKQTTAGKLLRELVDSDVLVRNGRGPQTRYRLMG
ncbi:MAG: putative DNA binding domain-containing protein [Atopobiaceae bacterium]|jgi:ATP-dependent DNA helicase RecG|nr:putative DNA binding domain-containing protein [Atopobiaceae bacterium]